MGENTAFGLGFLQALGRTALTDRERRKREEREQSDRDEEMNSRKLSTLQKMVEAEDLLPDSARNVAAMHAFRLATSDKTKPRDYETAMSEILNAASQPRPSQSPRSLARESARKVGTDPTNLAGWNAIAPMSNMGDAVEDEARRLPEPEMVSGILTRDEINSRNDLEFMRRLAMQQQIAQAGMKPQFFEVNPGARLVDASGKLIAEGNAPTPKQDFSRTFEEALMDPNLPPDRRKYIEDFVRMKYTNQGDQMRTGGAGGAGPRYQRQVFQKPDGTYTEVLTNPYDPSEPPVRRDFGGGIDKPMSDATKNAKAQTQGTIAMLQDVLTQLESGQVDPNAVFGKMNEFKYRVQSSGWVPFAGSPDPNVSNVRTDLANFNNELVKLRSGAAVSAQEWSRLQKELPIAGMAPDEVVQRIRRTVERLQRIFALRYGPNGVGDANVFPGDVEAQAQAPTPVAATPATPAPATPAPVTPARLPVPPPPPGFRLRGSTQ